MHAIGDDSTAGDFLYFSLLHFAHSNGQLPDEHVLWELLLWFEFMDRCIRALRGACRQWHIRLFSGWCCKCRVLKQAGISYAGWQYTLDDDTYLARHKGLYVVRLAPPCARVHPVHCYCCECVPASTTPETDNSSNQGSDDVHQEYSAA